MYDADAPIRRERRSFRPEAVASVFDRSHRLVFLHGMWRSGSTYLWSRFRALPTTCCFYEPLHHGLAKLTPDRIARDTPDKIGGNRHPALDDPYFLEFAPLTGKRGVAGFREDLAYDRFALRPDEAHPRLHAYIASLISHADEEARTAVLGFNRTGLRIAWLKARFPEACNIHIDRDPAAIWASYRAEMSRGNYAFFSMWLRVLILNAEHPVFAPLVERLGLLQRAPAIRTLKTAHRQIMDGMSDAESYFMIYYLWLACTEHAQAECDLVIDTRQADDVRYLHRTALRIAELSGLRIDLSDLCIAAPRVQPPRGLRTRIEYSAEALLPSGALPKTPLFPRRAPSVPRWRDDAAAAAA